MKLVIQRVLKSQVDVEGKTVGSIGKGLLVLIGVTHTDGEEELQWLVNKLIHLRIFHDENGKMNRSLLDIKGEVLLVSQFTLYADCEGGRRPSFTQAAKPEMAEKLYLQFAEELTKKGIRVQTGIFGAEMQVSLVNDGPVTITLYK